MNHNLILSFAELKNLTPKDSLLQAKTIRAEQASLIEKEKMQNACSNHSQFYLDDNTFSSKPFSYDLSYENNKPSDSSFYRGHKMFDLHGFTTIGAEAALRRIFTSVDRSKQQVIKINVGQGTHSQDGIAKLPDVVKKVANELQLPNPIKHEKNPGYLLMILPPIISTD